MKKQTYYVPVEQFFDCINCSLRVTPKGSVYYRGEGGELRKAQTVFRKSTGQLLVFVKGWQITLIRYDKTKKRFVHEVKKLEGKNVT